VLCDEEYTEQLYCIAICWLRGPALERWSLTNFSCLALDLQMMGDHLCG